MCNILFQGDSITDAGRARDNNHHLGVGYPHLIRATLNVDMIGKYEFLNRGISGNRIVDLYARIKADIINLKPDIMSILIGVNDVWHEIVSQNGVDSDKFYHIYCMLIEEVKEALPNIEIIIMEPFVLKASATEEHWNAFHVEVTKRAAAGKRVAEKYGLPFIPLQEKFDAAEKLAPANYWLSDGVHPTAAGHELIKREWLKVFENRLVEL